MPDSVFDETSTDRSTNPAGGDGGAWSDAKLGQIHPKGRKIVPVFKLPE